MTVFATVAANTCGHNGHRHAFTPLWGDEKRKAQLARLQALQRQECDKAGQAVWQMAFERWVAIPIWCRIDLPSPRVFSALLGLFRTGATLKERPILAIELSVEEIAALVMYGRAQVAAALRWLCDGAIEYFGHVVASGLGLITRVTRFGKGKFCGAIALAYRTSLSALTASGRMLLGLCEPATCPGTTEDRNKARRQQYKKQRSETRKKQAGAHLYTATPSPLDFINRDERVDLRAMTLDQLSFEVVGARHSHPSAHHYVYPSESEWQAKPRSYTDAVVLLVSRTQADTRDAVPDYIASSGLKV